MAGETTHNSTHAVQLTECCITGSLLDVDESSGEIKTCETPKDETIEQENQPGIDNTSTTDNTGCSLALEESKDVAILQELQNEFGIFRNDPETNKRLQTTDPMRTQNEDAAPTKDKDSITKESTKEEHDGKVGTNKDDNARQVEEVDSSLKKVKVIVAQGVEGSIAMVNQERNNDSNSCNEDGTIDIPKDEPVDITADDEIMIFCSQKKEVIIAQKIEESYSENSQKWSFNADRSIGIPKDEAVDVTTDDGIKVFEVDAKERMYSFDQMEALEPCGSPSFNELVEEHDGKVGITVEDNVRQEEMFDSSFKKGKVIVAQRAEGTNAMVNKKRNHDSKSCTEDGTIDIPKDGAVDITADYEMNVFEVHTKEQRDSFDQMEAVEPCGNPSLHKTAKEHEGRVGATVGDDVRQEEEVHDSSQKEKVTITQNVQESNYEVIQKGKEGFVGLSGDGSIGTPKDEVDIDIDIATYDETKVFKVDTKERMDSFDQMEAVEPCGCPSLHEPEGIFNEMKENDANSTFATSDQDQDSDEAQDISFAMLHTEGDLSSLCAKDGIAENIHQGELLLYRLHLVQQNQELQQVSDGPSASNTAAMVMTNDTVNSVTLRPGTEGKDDDLPCKVDTTQGNECQKEQSQVEVVDTSSAGIEEDDQVKMGKENIWRPLEETPIQREIRQGLEREKSLRRSRGLDDLQNKSEELVEIPVMRSSEVPDQSSDTNLGLNVERQLAKRKMLQDINQEVMKEQAMDKLGKVHGFYEEGYAQELKERRMLFEVFQQCKKTDTQVSSRGRKLFSSSFTAKNAETPFVRRLERTRSLDFYTNHHLKDSTCPSTGGESCQNDIDSHTECQIKDLEDDATSASSHETWSVQKSLRPSISSSSLDCSSGTMLSVQDKRWEEEEGSVLKGKNPFFQLRPSLSLRTDVEKEIREAMEREQELRRLRSQLYGDQWNRPGDQQERSTPSSCPEYTPTVSTDCVYRGKLTLIWPPPHSKVEVEPGPPKPIGQRSTLQHYWESGMVNSSSSQKD